MPVRMKSYEAFKSSREKIDPSSRKMNEYQWQQAYTAYKSTRERVHGRSSKRAERAGPSGSASTRSGMHTPSSVTPTASLRGKVRALSAYEDVRALVNLLAWIAVGAVLVHVITQCIFFASTETWVMAAVYAVLRLLCIFFVKAMAQVLIDIPDIALYRMHQVNASAELPDAEQ